MNLVDYLWHHHQLVHEPYSYIRVATKKVPKITNIRKMSSWKLNKKLILNYCKNSLLKTPPIPDHFQMWRQGMRCSSASGQYAQCSCRLYSGAFQIRQHGFHLQIHNIICIIHIMDICIIVWVYFFTWYSFSETFCWESLAPKFGVVVMACANFSNACFDFRSLSVSVFMSCIILIKACNNKHAIQ